MKEITPLTGNCAEIIKNRKHVCLGISPFNSLFSENYISDLIKWSLKNFESFHLFLPDEPTFYTLEALGYSPEECRKKMKKQLNWLKNKIHKALEENGLHNKEKYILNWEILSANRVFREELDKSFGLFDSDSEFRAQCMKASEWVLQNKLSEKEVTEKALLKAVKYFLSEIPLFSATNKIVGIESSIFCYHQSISFHEKLYMNDLSLKPARGQGYGIILRSEKAQ